MTCLDRATWTARAAAHAARVDAATAGHRERRADGRAHPVEDFLFRYYRHSPAKLRRWHPGAGIVLADAAGTEHAGWRHYRVDGDEVSVDVQGFLAERGPAVAFVRELLTATLSRPPHLGCFGLHEWAMVHRLPQDDVRHPGWPLRLGPEATDDVLERHTVRCTHFDAHRFFTDSAAPRNTVTPTRERQTALEQPGCLHAGMDVYKWAFKLAPLVPSDLTADAFELAHEIRVLDMRASPYDLRDLGYEPVMVETAEGKAEYLERQRAFTDRSNALRRRLLDVLEGSVRTCAP
ncbi:3-methyladenine DNA glycosylase [Phycicoccus sp. BSK3Z-2]|uniref:3-methyladenine DNA glycosylase n=1 Tax=Phycicoccus avicenniae TaxID=2828860 RepID=A0A941I1Z5_9MICO|nr:3-methyladenine DNA glycosylase [Phycicoccus avicenniae]MBR7744529.1 3-methyladenine DNA glycosylase [Phycicoccus avicenniae]